MANGAFNPGTGTLKSTNLIAAFAELAMLIQYEEAYALGSEATLTANNVEVPDFFSYQANFDNDTINISANNIPIQTSLVGGKLTVDPVDYISPLTAYVPSIDGGLDVTGADIVNTNKIAALVELAQLIQQDEALDAELDNNLTLTIDSDANTMTINASFPCLPSVDTEGNIKVIATNYLAI